MKSFFREKIDLDSFKQVEQLWRKQPSKPIRLPVIAYQITHDPHGLDSNKGAGKILYSCLKKTYPSIDVDTELYLKLNIVRDDILNFTTIQNILADDELFQVASDRHLIWNVPLMELLTLDKVLPNKGDKIFIIENSSVFAILAEKFPYLPMIMSSGQFKYATWKLLDLFEENVDLYYGSDIDPAGLVMAEKLLKKYPKRVHLLGMSTEVYQKYLHDGKKLDNSKLKLLDGINNSDIQSIKNSIKQNKKAVYQEAELLDLVTEIRKKANSDRR